MNRLGVNGPNEAKHHIWMKDFNWGLLLEKSVRSPLDISVESVYDYED